MGKVTLIRTRGAFAEADNATVGVLFLSLYPTVHAESKT